MASLLAALPASGLAAQELREGVEYPRRGSSLQFRITNRRYVNRIVFEAVDNQQYVTLLLAHPPSHWAFKSQLHALRHPCAPRAECLRIMRRLDQFLQTGWNIGLRLNGSEIVEIRYYEAPGS